VAMTPTDMLRLRGYVEVEGAANSALAAPKLRQVARPTSTVGGAVTPAWAIASLMCALPR
jgi:hypothetical protein